MKKLFNSKKRILTLLGALSFSVGTLLGQVAPNGVCTQPSTYSFDQEVTWYFDLSGNDMVSPGDNLFYWSWTPQALPGGAEPLTYVKDMTWSMTFTPTTLYGLTLAEIEADGNGAFWCTLRNESGTSVTGTLPFSLKEELRLGTECACTGAPVNADETYYINFGNTPFNGTDSDGDTWTNVSQPEASYALLDKNGIHRYDITTSESFQSNNYFGLETPDVALLDDVAEDTATSSYFYISTCEGTITLSCLDQGHEYKISVFGSRNTSATRASRYTVAGASIEEGVLQTSGYNLGVASGLNANDDEFFTAQVFPDGSGTINIDVAIEEGGYAYVNLIKIEEFVNPTIIPVTGIDIDASSISSNGPSQIQVNYSPANTSETSVFWSVDDPTVATIDHLGVLRPLKEGTVTVTATSGFNGTLVDQETVVFSDFITELYLGGTASEAGTDNATDALVMRRIYDADSTFTNQYEIFTSLASTGSFSFFTSQDGSATEFGGSAGTLIEGDGNEIPTISGWKYITVDLNTNSYDVTNINGWNVISNMLPLEAHQTGWWGGDEPLTTYEGNGVWSATIDFSVRTHATDIPRLYFQQAGTSRKLKWVDDTKNDLMFEDQLGSGCGSAGIKLDNVKHFNGEFKVIIDLQNYTFDMQKECVTQDTMKIVYMGSSVCKGYGAEPVPDEPWEYLGYAYNYREILEARAVSGDGYDYNFANVSIGGNNTQDILNRMDRNLWPECGKYVVIGLSMANEGLLSGGIATFYQFEENMGKIIDSVRARGMEPMIMGNYANASYGPEEYELIKDMNLLIHQWDVPSTNVLGALEDRTGKFLDDYISDPWHPNNDGFLEFTYALVPSLFDALTDNKPQPTKVENTYITMNKSMERFRLEFIPEETVHSFTYSFDIKTDDQGIIASFEDQGVKKEFSIQPDGTINYADLVLGAAVINDDQWHKVTLSHYHALGVSILYVDGVEQGTVNEQLVPTLVSLSDENGPSAEYRELYFYRSAMNINEITAMVGGALLKSSLEIYAPLDGMDQTSEATLHNHAQCLNTISKVHYDTYNVFIEAEDFHLAMDAQVVPCSEGGDMVTDYLAGEWMVWHIDLPVTGDYVVEYRVSSPNDDTQIRLENVYADPIYGYITVPNTGGEQNWTTISHIVSLDSGEQYIAIYSSTGGFNLNWINIVPALPNARGLVTIEEENLSIYPNPADDEIHIAGLPMGAEVTVISTAGQEIKSVMSDELYIGDLETGMYFLRITEGGQSVFKSFVKR